MTAEEYIIDKLEVTEQDNDMLKSDLRFLLRFFREEKDEHIMQCGFFLTPTLYERCDEADFSRIKKLKEAYGC